MFIDTIKQIFSRTSIVAINQFFSLIAISFLAVTLSLQSFGEVAIGLVLIQISWIISDWGSTSFSIEEWAQKKTHLQQNKFITIVSFLRGFIAVICLIFFKLVDLNGIYNIPTNTLLLIAPAILFGAVFPLWYFQIQKTTHDLIVITFFSRLVYLGIIILFVEHDDDILWVFIAQSTAVSLYSIYSFIVMQRYYFFKAQIFKFYDLWLIQKRSFLFLINAIVNNQISSFWTLGMSIFGSTSSVGIFSLGEQIYRAGSAFSGIIAQSVRINYINKSFKEAKLTLVFFTLLYICISCIICIYIESLITHFLSFEYYLATDVIQIMVLAWGFHAIIKLINYPILGELQGVSKINRFTLFFLFVHIVGFFIWSIFLMTLYHCQFHFLS